MNQQQVERLVALLPDLSLARLKQFGDGWARDRQRVLVRLLAEAFAGRRSHKWGGRGKWQGASTFSREWLRTKLHGKRDGADRPLLRLFFEVSERYHSTSGTTMAYVLLPTVADALATFYRQADPIPAPCSAEDGAHSPIVVSNGFPEAYARETGLYVPNVLTEIDQRQAAHAIAAAYKANADPTVLAELHIAREEIERCGGMPNEFATVGANGRVYPTGRSHLTSMSREARGFLLEGLQWYDYDADSCHLRIFADLGAAYGFATGHITRYLLSKSEVHEAWAQMIGHDNPDDLKEAVLSILNTAPLSASGFTSIGQLLSREQVRKLQTLSVFTALVNELREGMKVIVAAAHGVEQEGRREVVYCNAVGGMLLVAPKSEDHPPPKQLVGAVTNHLLTGYEQFIVRTCLARVRGLKTFAYDGWISSDESQGIDLEDHVLKESEKATGVKLHLRLKVRAF